MIRVLEASVGVGDAGALDSLELMRRVVNDSLTDPALVGAARVLATRVAADRDTWAQAIGIRAFLARYWRFVDDPFEREVFRDPAAMLEEYSAIGYITGDCDEAAILGAALAKAIGLAATFTIYAFSDSAGVDGGFSHVFASILTPEGCVLSLDVTKPAGPCPMPTREHTEAV